MNLFPPIPLTIYVMALELMLLLPAGLLATLVLRDQRAQRRRTGRALRPTTTDGHRDALHVCAG